MGKMVLITLLGFALAGCAAAPAKDSTPLAAFNKLIVRDINWKETAVSEIEGKDLKEYIAAQPRLSEIFQKEFGKYIGDIRFFGTVTYGDAPADADTLILEPKIYTLKPGGFMPGADYTGLLKTSDGRLVGKYTYERRLNQAHSSKVMENIEELVTELGEDAASRLPYAR